MKINKFFITLLSLCNISTFIFATKSTINSSSFYKIINIDNISQSGINSTFAAKFTLFLAILLLTTILIGKLLKKIFNLPIVAGQIIGGIFLGPSLLNIKEIPFFSQPLQFVDVAKKHIYQIASADLFFFFILLISSAITVAYLLWLAGHETDVADMAKVGVESTIAGFLGAIFPILMISTTIYFIFGNNYSIATAIGIGVIFSATSVSIPVAMLISQNKMKLRSSKATMGAAIVDDILAVILFSIFIVLLQGGMLGKTYCIQEIGHCTGISTSMIYMFVSFIIMFLFGRYFVVYFTRMLRNLRLSYIIPSFATLIMLSYFSVAELIGGLAGITGAYFAGFFHRMGDPRHKAVRAISPFVNTVLLPTFLGSVGMQVDVTVLNPTDWLVVVTILFVSIISKLFGCQITTAIANLFIKDSAKKWSSLESYLFGSSMVARGEVGLVIATILNSTNIMNVNQYVICVVAIVLTTIASPIMLSIGFKELDKKLKKEEQEKEFYIKIGPFKYLSSRYLFDIVSAMLEKEYKVTPIVALSEGKKILTVEQENIEIILEPETGIIFKGNEVKIHEILDNLRNLLTKDIETIPEM